MITAICLPGEIEPDQHGAFRGRLTLTDDSAVEIRLLGASSYHVWLDGQFLTEGPIRYEHTHPEYSSHLINWPRGEHVLAVHLHWVGEPTRLLEKHRPFLWCRALVGDNSIPIAWKCRPLGAWRKTVRRVNPQLSWIEWRDTRLDLNDWQRPSFDDAAWDAPVEAAVDLPDPHPPTIGEVAQIVHSLQPMAGGPLTELYGYESDDLAVRFTLRDLNPALPPQGTWRRYDLGRVRLGRPRLTLDLPAGTVVEWALAEHLYALGRVTPFITLSTGTSCNLDHFVARGGVQEFCAFHAKGGRYLEVHVLAPPEQTRFLEEQFVERTYWRETAGAFSCDNPLLDRVWAMGIETLRACAEDGVTDNPTRERGQWTGDVVTVGMDLAAAGFTDLRPLRRGLTQAGYGARSDGLVSGMTPSGIYLSSYAAQWINACLHYVELTGDRSLLVEMYPFAIRNLEAFEPFVSESGLTDGLGWAFIDWGYDRGDGPIDVALNMHYLAALRAMRRWCQFLNQNERLDHFVVRAHRIESVLQNVVRKIMSGEDRKIERLGYHATTLALGLGLVDAEFERDAVAYLKRHILDCFPNRPDAPRLSDPGVTSRQLITPYFAQYAFPVLIERGEMDFVLNQYETCWGWMIETGATTCLEVFDPRWSHCHQWAACPTWQMSRYLLGLHPRLDLGEDHYVLRLETGSLTQAQGVVPSARGPIGIQWTRKNDHITWRVQSAHPIHLHLGHADAAVQTVESMILDLPVRTERRHD